MSETTPFYQEVRHSLMVRGDEWKPVVETLHEHVNAFEATGFLQSADQLTYLTGQGHIAGNLIETKLDAKIVSPFLNNEQLTLENITLQWLYRFIIVEAVVEHLHKEPISGWPPMFQHTVDQGLHFMLYMAALLVLIEENKIEYARCDEDNLQEKMVKERVKQACEFLHPKAQDYGESFRRHGIAGLMPRLWDKIARYAQLKADNRPGNFEKKEDSARDLLGYCCIAYSLMLELPQDVREGFQPTAVYETESNVSAGAEWKKIK